jgi:hypothetical protein
MILVKHATSMCTTAEVWNLSANRYSGYLNKEFFHNLEQCPSEFKPFKNYKKLMIPPSKNKRYVRLADSPKEQYDDRPFK